MKTLVLRFRDLVTPNGGTIDEHRVIIQRFGSAWWGWWKRQYETTPSSLFRELAQLLESTEQTPIFLLDAGQLVLYEAALLEIRVSPGGTEGILTPDPNLSPSYYHRGRYPVWFRLGSISEVKLDGLNLKYSGFPSRPEVDTYSSFVGSRVPTVEHMRNIDVTLWEVHTDE